MTALAAARLGYRTHVFAPEPDGPAAQVTNLATSASYEDATALARFARSVDVITIEFENLPLALGDARAGDADAAGAGRARDLPGPGPGKGVSGADRCRRRATGPCAMRTSWPRAGRARRPQRAEDGRPRLRRQGSIAAEAGADAAAAWAAFGAEVGVLEAWVDFAAEISVITARAADGAQVSYPPVENRHHDHILAHTIAPAPIAPELAAEATTLAQRIAAELDVVGLLAVEMFVTREGRLLVNELAPRPHNSGHWTIDACAVSQFEQLVRAVCGLPLGAPAPFAHAVMDNLLGRAVDAWPELLAEPGARVHLYGKRDPARPQAGPCDAADPAAAA